MRAIGYAAILHALDIKALPNYQASYLSEKGGKQTIHHSDGTLDIVFPRNYDPGLDLLDQFVFALKYEGVNLEILSAAFAKINPLDISNFIAQQPTGRWARKIWFLYEFLTERSLPDLPDLKMGNYVDLLDTTKYYTSLGKKSRRHRINNNLLGNQDFCPFVRRTVLLNEWEQKKLNERAASIFKNAPDDIMTRAVHYLYTKETKSSYAIEREALNNDRISRFVRTLQSAGSSDFLNKDKLVWLQNQIVDKRFINTDYRTSQNYVGESVNAGRETIHFISPKPEDIPKLMGGLTQCHERMMESKISPVIHAAVISFAFVFIHPFDDGNGRIHRLLIHHILAKTKFSPQGMILPVSATLLRNIKKYDETLESFSKVLMPLIEYRIDPKDGVLEVQNETSRHYKFVDMTRICEDVFLFLEETIKTDLPNELNFLIVYDRAKKAIQSIVDMPDQKIDQFVKFCLQNNGVLSSSKRRQYFDTLTDAEVSKMELLLRESILKL